MKGFNKFLNNSLKYIRKNTHSLLIVFLLAILIALIIRNTFLEKSFRENFSESILFNLNNAEFVEVLKCPTKLTTEAPTTTAMPTTTTLAPTTTAMLTTTARPTRPANPEKVYFNLNEIDATSESTQIDNIFTGSNIHTTPINEENGIHTITIDKHKDNYFMWLKNMHSNIYGDGYGIDWIQIYSTTNCTVIDNIKRATKLNSILTPVRNNYEPSYIIDNLNCNKVGDMIKGSTYNNQNHFIVSNINDVFTEGSGLYYIYIARDWVGRLIENNGQYQMQSDITYSFIKIQVNILNDE